MDKSKYAKRLRELGCAPLFEGLVETDLLWLEAQGAENSPLSRRERKRLLSLGTIPSFAPDPYDHSTVILMDDFGIIWKGPVQILPVLKKELKFSDLDERLLERWSKTSVPKKTSGH